MSIGQKLQFPERTSSSWGVPYRLSVFGNPSYLCIFGNSRTWKRCFWLKWLGRTIILMWKRRTKNRSCLRHHLDCMWRSCWLAPVACVGLFSSTYPIVFVLFLQFLVECLHHRFLGRPLSVISVWCMVPVHEVHRNLIRVFGTFVGYSYINCQIIVMCAIFMHKSPMKF